MSEFHHVSVLLEECIEGLAIKPDGIYVDGTLGGAGHSSRIAAKLTTGRLIGIDRDNVALEAAADEAARCGFVPRILTTEMSGEARLTAARLVAEARRAQAGLRPGDAPLCLLAGGETTVTIRGSGKGGRNQEMALAATLELADDRGIDLICVGTDGTDGPTDAAGGYAFSGDLARLRAIGLHPEESLGANDSYPLLLKARTLLRTGPTRTNVMDVSIILVRPK